MVQHDHRVNNASFDLKYMIKFAVADRDVGNV